MINVRVSASQWARQIKRQRKTALQGAITYLKEQLQVYNGPIYGYDSRDGQLYPNVVEQEVIMHIKALRAMGKPYRTIAAELNTAGLPTKNGGPWRASTVHKICART